MPASLNFMQSMLMTLHGHFSAINFAKSNRFHTVMFTFLLRLYFVIGLVLLAPNFKICTTKSSRDELVSYLMFAYDKCMLCVRLTHVVCPKMTDEQTLVGPRVLCVFK